MKIVNLFLSKTSASLLLLLSVLIFSISCDKSDILKENTLEGKWKLTGSYISIGGPQEFRPASKKSKDYIEFKTNGEFQGDIFSDYVSYVIKDSTTLQLIKKDNTIQNYFYKINEGELTMGPAGPIYCIEGCSTVYVKVRSGS